MFERVLEDFKKLAFERAKYADSRIVLAFDSDVNPYKFGLIKHRNEILARISTLLSELREEVAGIKFGLPVMLALDLEKLKKLIAPFKKEYFFTCDLKMADIGYVNRLVTEQVFGLGFDALIVHALIGVKNGLDEVVASASKGGHGTLAVCAMSHEGAKEFLNEHFKKLAAIAVSAGVDGLILPATFPHLISWVRKKYPQTLILSPGVGVQGAPFGSALKAGADFEIIGRAIYTATSPIQKTREIKEAMG